VYVLTQRFCIWFVSISLCLYRSNSRTPCPILMKFGRHVQHGQEIYCIVLGLVGHRHRGLRALQCPILLTIAKHESSSQNFKKE
ncbi:hypothetical protein WDU94_003199, partial [Cyamophila willieti]